MRSPQRLPFLIPDRRGLAVSQITRGPPQPHGEWSSAPWPRWGCLTLQVSPGSPFSGHAAQPLRCGFAINATNAAPHHTQLTKALLIPSFSSRSAHQGRRVHQAPDKWAFVIRRRISRHLPLVARSPQHAASRLTGCAGTGPGDKGRASKD